MLAWQSPDASDRSGRGKSPPAGRSPRPPLPAPALGNNRPLLLGAPPTPAFGAGDDFNPRHRTVSSTSANTVACTGAYQPDTPPLCKAAITGRLHPNDLIRPYSGARLQPSLGGTSNCAVRRSKAKRSHIATVTISCRSEVEA
jgi:hypothetical protein